MPTRVVMIAKVASALFALSLGVVFLIGMVSEDGDSPLYLRTTRDIAFQYIGKPETLETFEDLAKMVAPELTRPIHQRRFVAYRSSQWEKLYLERLDSLDKLWGSNKKKMCSFLFEDEADFLHDFLNLTCSSRIEAEGFDHWCVLDDGVTEHPLWFNTKNKETIEVTFERPFPEDIPIPPPSPIQPTKEHEHVMSKFIFLDESTGETYEEFIEPLVSHLRFPLAQCMDTAPGTSEYRHDFSQFKGFVLPPPKSSASHRHNVRYFDVGATSFHGHTPTSVEYFAKTWERHGLAFDELHAFEPSTSRQKFMDSVPLDYVEKTRFHQAMVAAFESEHEYGSPFPPHFIKEAVHCPNDYVILKLDSGSFEVEDGTIGYLLKHPQSVDELIWDHHIGGHHFGSDRPSLASKVPEVPLWQTYTTLLQLRHKGIRAHSWI